MNWVLCGSCAACLPVLLLLKVDYKRLNVDVSSNGDVTTGNHVLLGNDDVVVVVRETKDTLNP